MSRGVVEAHMIMAESCFPGIMSLLCFLDDFAIRSEWRCWMICVFKSENDWVKEVGLFRDPLLDEVFLQKTKHKWVFKVLFTLYNNLVTYALYYNVYNKTTSIIYLWWLLQWNYLLIKYLPILDKRQFFTTLAFYLLV
jgi:hypothetical protein